MRRVIRSYIKRVTKSVTINIKKSITESDTNNIEESIMKRRHLIYPVVLLSLSVLLILLTYEPGSRYGSTVDWFTQHVTIADVMRQTILEEGTLFPGRLPLGGGNNIYDFSYYGYLRPDVLLACLMPSVPMEYVIIAYSLVGYFASVLLFYFLLKKVIGKEEPALLGGILFLCAGCFFHIHRHVMFVNYMPFLIGAMLGVLRYHKTGKKLLLILMMFFIVMHSYYYAIAAWVVIYLFLLYTAGTPYEKVLCSEEVSKKIESRGIESVRRKARRWKKGSIGQESNIEPQVNIWKRMKKRMIWIWGYTWRYGVWALTAAAMAGVLLLPTAASILSCAEFRDGGSASTNPWTIRLDFSALLYDGYGLGLTMIALFLLVLSLCRKKSRLLASFLLFALVCGLVPLVLNGFLYNRAKILIPFLPLVLVLCVETFVFFLKKRKKATWWVLIPVIVAAWLQYEQCGIVWVWLDVVLVLLVFLMLRFNAKWGTTGFKSIREKVMRTKCLQEKGAWERNHLQKVNYLPAAMKITLSLICVLIFIYAIEAHKSDDFIAKEETSISSFTEEERKQFYGDGNYRFDTYISPFQSANYVLAPGAERTSMYTSTYNGRYSSFFYDEIRVPNGQDLRIGQYSNPNPFFQYLMGVRYLETTEEKLPWGYEVKQKNGKAVLAENENVLPLYYGSTQLLSATEYEKLSFPEKLETMVNYSVVEGDVTNDNPAGFLSHMTEIFPKEGVDYEIRQDSENRFTIIPKKPVENQIIVITFHVESKNGRAVNITINGTKNRLSGNSAPYPNHNEDFIYYLASNEPMTEFGIRTSGEYEISELHIYSLDTDYFGGLTVHPLREVSVAEENVLEEVPSGEIAETENQISDGQVTEHQKNRIRIGTKNQKEIIVQGVVDMPAEGYFITSIPMQEGYRAFVDGEEREVETVNQAFVGFPVEAGSHEIEITYEPPLQTVGMILSMIGWISWLGCCFIRINNWQ